MSRKVKYTTCQCMCPFCGEDSCKEHDYEHEPDCQRNAVPDERSNYEKLRPKTLDDRGNAELLIYIYGHELRWVEDVGKWAVFDVDSGLWSFDDHAAGRLWDSVTDMMQLEVPELRAILKDDKAQDWQVNEAKALLKHITYSRNQGRATSTLLTASRDERVRAKLTDFDRDDLSLGCADNVVHLGEEVTTTNLQSGDLLTMSTHVLYRDHAMFGPPVGESAWRMFLRRVLPDEDKQRYLQKLIGYAARGGNPARQVICITGPTSSGKTTFVEAIKAALGDYAATMPGSVLRDNQDERARADIAGVIRKRLVVSEELGRAWHLHADQIKRLAGGGAVTARKPYAAEYIDATPKFTACFVANEPPTIKYDDDALWRRIVVVNFNETISKDEEDPGLAELLRTDQAAQQEILRWIVEGYRMYATEGLWPLPESMVPDQLGFRVGASEFHAFVADCLWKVDNDRFTPFRSLWKVYNAWCDTNHVNRGDRLTERKFAAKLTEFGFNTDNVKNKETGQAKVTVRRGVRIRKRWRTYDW